MEWLAVGEGLAENNTRTSKSLSGYPLSWLKFPESRTVEKVWPEVSPASSSPGGSFGEATGSLREWGGACAAARWDRYGYRGRCGTGVGDGDQRPGAASGEATEA